jgi:hypothetical protein
MKIYKILEDYSYIVSDFVHSKESLYLEKDDLIFIENNILTKLLRNGEFITKNIINPQLGKYGLGGFTRVYDVEIVSRFGISERISGTSNGYYEFNPIEDITIRYLRNEKLLELL